MYSLLASFFVLIFSLGQVNSIKHQQPPVPAGSVAYAFVDAGSSPSELPQTELPNSYAGYGCPSCQLTTVSYTMR